MYYAFYTVLHDMYVYYYYRFFVVPINHVYTCSTRCMSLYTCRIICQTLLYLFSMCHNLNISFKKACFLLTKPYTKAAQMENIILLYKIVHTYGWTMHVD